VALAAAVLFAAYLRQSQSVPVPSDGSGNVLQAWDMLHGNLLLHGWWVSDVSFATTELPQYLLLETVLGPVTSVVNVAAAMSYTLLVLLAALLAKGRAPGREGACRALLAAGIMVSPQLSATPILLLSPDHTGTGVPMLVGWLVIDRFRPARPWLRPALAGVILTWTMIADPVVLVTVIVPLVAVCAARARRRRDPDELRLAAAAAVAAGAGLLAPRIVAALGGYRQWGLGTGTTGQLPHAALVTCQAILELFGANVFAARPGIEVAFAALHLAGVALVVCALACACRSGCRDELLVPVFAVAIAVNVAAYLISTHSRDVAGAREMAAVLPLGAVLAGRLLGGLLTASRFRAVAAAAAAGYLAALCYAAAQPPAPPASQPLASWLVSHGFRVGLAGYWQASSTTVDTRGRVLAGGVTVSGGRVVIYKWETDAADYDPARHDANFVVTGAPDRRSAPPGLLAAAERTFGPPRQVYRYRGYTIAVWDANLLRELHM
jgi:hypothetical protein